MIAGQNASNKRQMDQLQDQFDYIRGEFKAKLTNKEANSENFINTHSELQLEESDNIYSYLDSKITNLHTYLNTEYVSKIQNLIKIETSKLGEEIASDINLIEKRMANQKTEFEIWEDTSKKAMFSLEAMIEQQPLSKKPSVPKVDNSRSQGIDYTQVSRMIEAALKGISEDQKHLSKMQYETKTASKKSKDDH